MFEALSKQCLACNESCMFVKKSKPNVKPSDYFIKDIIFRPESFSPIPRTFSPCPLGATFRIAQPGKGIKF